MATIIARMFYLVNAGVGISVCKENSSVWRSGSLPCLRLAAPYRMLSLCFHNDEQKFGHFVCFTCNRESFSL